MAISGGRLGAIVGNGTITTYQTLYKPAAALLATVAVTVCNRSASTRTIRIAQVQNAASDPTPAAGEFKVYSRTMQPAGDANGKDVLQLTGMVLNGNNDDQVVISSGGADVDFTCDGVTEAI